MTLRTGFASRGLAAARALGGRARVDLRAALFLRLTARLRRGADVEVLLRRAIRAPLGAGGAVASVQAGPVVLAPSCIARALHVVAAVPLGPSPVAEPVTVGIAVAVSIPATVPVVVRVVVSVVVPIPSIPVPVAVATVPAVPVVVAPVPITPLPVTPVPVMLPVPVVMVIAARMDGHYAGSVVGIVAAIGVAVGRSVAIGAVIVAAFVARRAACEEAGQGECRSERQDAKSHRGVSLAGSAR